MTQTIDSIEYLDVDEAAALLSVKKATLYAYVSRGLLRSFRQGVGRKRLYRRADRRSAVILFHYSLVYLALLFGAMAIDKVL